MAYFNEATLRRIQQAIDIVELIGERVSLKKAGKEFKGLCPFHADRNPSMFVSPGKQIFKCFVCGSGGDVFKFVQLADRVEFPEAVRVLAGRAGIELVEERPDPSVPRGPGKVALAEINTWAARKFRDWLGEPAGEPGRKYFEKRGFTAQTIRRFGLGYAPGGWDNLLRAGAAEGKDAALLAAAGLLTASRRAAEAGEARFYDTFRDRVIFPILDASNRVIGFGGRTLGDDVPKYLNTAETPLFSKGRELYGLRWGREAVSASGTVAIVEGYTDVLMAHQAGVANVVATLGTALTEQHMRVLGRLAKRIVLVFDADVAGAKAADRALELFLSAGVDLAVATMPAGMDPCDLVRRDGGPAFAAVLESACEALEFKWRTVREQFGGATGLADRAAAAEAMIGTLAGMAGYDSLDPIRRGLMLDRLAALLGSSSAELNRMLARQTRHRRPRGDGRAEAPGAPDPAAGQAETAGQADGPRRALDLALEQVLGVLLASPSYYDSIRQALKPADFVAPALRAVAEPVFELAGRGELSLTAVLRRIESPQLAELVTDLPARVERLGDLGRTLQQAMAALEHQRALAQAQEAAARVRSGNYSDEDLLALSRRPKDVRRGGS